MRVKLLIVLLLTVTITDCRKSQQVTPIRVPGRVYSSPSAGAAIIHQARLGEVLKSPMVSHQKEGDTPNWWAIETSNGTGVGAAGEFALFPLASVPMYTQVATDLRDNANTRAGVIRTLPPHEKVLVATRVLGDANWVLLVKDGAGMGFVEKSTLDTVP